MHDVNSVNANALHAWETEVPKLRPHNWNTNLRHDKSHFLVPYYIIIIMCSAINIEYHYCVCIFALNTRHKHRIHVVPHFSHMFAKREAYTLHISFICVYIIQNILKDNS